MELADKIRLARQSRVPKVSQLAAAELLGVSRPAYVTYETGRSRPARRYLEVLAENWSIPLAWFYDEAANEVPGKMDAVQPIPYLGIAPAGEFDFDAVSVGATIDVPAQFAGPNKYAFRIGGESMANTLMHGDIIIVLRTKSPPLGSIVAVITADHEFAIKRYSYVNGEYILQSDNLNFPPVERRDCEFFGQVVHLIRESV